MEQREAPWVNGNEHACARAHELIIDFNRNHPTADIVAGAMKKVFCVFKAG